MRLISVNVGTPREVEWSGRTVRTAFFKQPVDGPRFVRRLGVEGDQQADLVGHGGEHRAVFVYQQSSYRHWEAFLGRQPMAPGSFGENFTVEGVPDEEVCIGDRYRIGQALFEVSQPRVTCFKVGMGLGEPRMPALLYEHGRPGFYLRVLEEGQVQAGDRIELVARGAEQMTVREISALLYLPGHSEERLRRALGVPALPEGWRGSFQALLEQGDRRGNPGLTSAAATRAVAWTGLRDFRVAEIQDETPTVRALELEPLDGQPLPGYAAGQYVTVSLPGQDGEPLLRSYSLSSAGGARRWRISVKREPSGRAGEVIHRRLAVGEVVPLGAPRGKFTVPDDERPIVFLGAGIGVTPLLAMLDGLARSPDAREVWWIYSARSAGEVPHARETQALLAQLGARTLVHYTREAGRRMTARELRELGPPLDAHFMLCGPDGFMEDMTAGLVSDGVAPGRIHRESFATTRSGGDRSVHVPDGPEGPGPAISFARSGLTVRWDPTRYTSLLELAEACDVPVTWSCRTGACHLCESAVIAGQVEYAPAPLDAPAEGNALLCCSVPSRELALDI
ncbi:MAG TPA: MOSC and FAD-binding oxidoreductase domain-containing protein [Solirubrobacteraceae bacterium]|nr:MOSC and FAD-binding oxidoreductase domain-containing protein [Solirubrobacteraceae bacterium]